MALYLDTNLPEFLLQHQFRDSPQGAKVPLLGCVLPEAQCQLAPLVVLHARHEDVCDLRMKASSSQPSEVKIHAVLILVSLHLRLANYSCCYSCLQVRSITLSYKGMRKEVRPCRGPKTSKTDVAASRPSTISSFPQVSRHRHRCLRQNGRRGLGGALHKRIDDQRHGYRVCRLCLQQRSRTDNQEEYHN